MGLPEVKLGVIPGYGGTQRLPRLVGRGVAQELILTGEFVDAQRALAVGLVNRIVPPGELLEACRELATKMLAAGPLAVRAAMAAVDEGLDGTLDEGLAVESAAFGRLFDTADAAEGLSAFLEKRKAVFEGR
jgi:enoyl-CoA hydratase